MPIKNIGPLIGRQRRFVFFPVRTCGGSWIWLRWAWLDRGYYFHFMEGLKRVKNFRVWFLKKEGYA